MLSNLNEKQIDILVDMLQIYFSESIKHNTFYNKLKVYDVFYNYINRNYQIDADLYNDIYTDKKVTTTSLVVDEHVLVKMIRRIKLEMIIK